MGQSSSSGPQFRADRPAEQEAVRTTIVGGRPPGSGQALGDIPRGIEVLVKKASVDPAFRELLLEQRAAAAETIGLELTAAETAMLAAVPREQLKAVIANTVVPEEHRRVFLGKFTIGMLVAAGIIAVASTVLSAGVRPHRSRTKGIQPDRPMPKPAGISPDRPLPKPELPLDETPEKSAEGEQP